jgi:FixJ family two-component response regulator
VAVVENDPGMLKALERVLGAHDFVVETYASAEAFVERGSASELSCLVLDIHLDGISGIELRLQLAASGDATPVIFLTAVDSQKTRQEAMDAGCVAILLKPFLAASLLSAIGMATG